MRSKIFGMSAEIKAETAVPVQASAAQPKSTDWSTAVVNSIMSRYPSATKLGGWGYQVGFALYGAYLVYERTHNTKYLTYIENWVDTYVDANGNINQSFNSLDSMQAGNLLVLLNLARSLDAHVGIGFNPNHLLCSLTPDRG